MRFPEQLYRRSFARLLVLNRTGWIVRFLKQLSVCKDIIREKLPLRIEDFELLRLNMIPGNPGIFAVIVT